MQNAITRQKRGKHYQYFKQGQKITDQAVIDRINKLAIPPAWQNVQIAQSSRAKIQATGTDSAGRQQYIYSEMFRIEQDKKKFERILRFAQELPKLRKQLKKDLGRKKLSKERVLACIVMLIDQEYFRVGNEQYAREHETYGITTIRSKHTTISSTTIEFDFVGKSGQQHHKRIRNSQLARLIKQLDEMPGYQIFRYQDDDGTMRDITSSDVNAYIKQHMGDDFTAKDFRTWGGTLLATSALLKEKLDEASTKTARQKTVTAIVKKVAKRLGNTPAIARSSYIDPRVFSAFENQQPLTKVKNAMKNMKPRAYLSIEEQCVLKLLQP